jgi:acetyl esterase/lipase
MKATSVFLFCLGSLLSTFGQPTNSFPLWSEGAPGALGKADKDIPTLTPYYPDPAKATGAAFVICPGGGYGGLAPHEGIDYAHFFNEHGVAGFVLKYRLGPSGYHHPAMLQDAARALRTVRARAGEWKLDAHRIGIIGSSAGGHLASTLLTHFDAGKADAADPIERENSRPDLGILCYPVVTLQDPFAHAGSRKNLLGPNPTSELVTELSNELKVTKETPPCFIWHTCEDTVVPVENSLQFAAALRKFGVPFDLHIYEKGKHGMGLGSQVYGGGDRHPWTKDCVYWLKGRGWVKE